MDKHDTGFASNTLKLPFRIPFGPQLARNFVEDAARVRLRNNPPRLRPLIMAYFVTFRCNLQCSYCDYTRNKFSSLHPELGTKEAKEVLRICREGVPSIGFTGGEPLMRDDIVELVRTARDLGYRPISLFTNSLACCPSGKKSSTTSTSCRSVWTHWTRRSRIGSPKDERSGLSHSRTSSDMRASSASGGSASM